VYGEVRAAWAKSAPAEKVDKGLQYSSKIPIFTPQLNLQHSCKLKRDEEDQTMFKRRWALEVGQCANDATSGIYR